MAEETGIKQTTSPQTVAALPCENCQLVYRSTAVIEIKVVQSCLVTVRMLLLCSYVYTD